MSRFNAFVCLFDTSACVNLGPCLMASWETYTLTHQISGGTFQCYLLFKLLIAA
eukprot:m.38128 g.38128  ORF g.38128 m.38128 type:complete len:54 (+) comp32527_c0_seq3:308-469(+)